MAGMKGGDATTYTLQSYEALAQDDATRDELVNGRLLREPQPGPLRGGIQLKIGVILRQHVLERGLGRVFTGTGFLLREEPPTVRAPDVAFVVRDRVPVYGLPRGYLHGAPDLAVEILSPAERTGDVWEKVRDYLAAGGAEVWVVDARSRTVTVHRGGGEARRLERNMTLEGTAVLPGFRVPVREFFTP